MSAPDNPVPRLPHAAPFLLLDRVVSVAEKHGVFVKLVSSADPCLAADGRLPAAFVLEALAQGGGALVVALGGATVGYLAAVDDFRMHGEVRAGDTLQVEVEIVRILGGAYAVRATGTVDGELRAEGRITLQHPR